MLSYTSNRTPPLPETQKKGFFSIIIIFLIARSLEAVAGTASVVLRNHKGPKLFLLFCSATISILSFYCHGCKRAATAPGIRPDFSAKEGGRNNAGKLSSSPHACFYKEAKAFPEISPANFPLDLID